MTRPGRPCVFLDRDGTLHTDVDFLRRPDELELYPGVGAALAAFRSAGFATVVVTNQSGVGRGLLTEEELGRVHRELQRRLAADGGALDGIYWSPFHPTEARGAYRRESDCRKPGPGMLLRAARDLGLDLARSWIVGDAARDLEAGRRAGVRGGVLVATGKGAREHGRLAAAGVEHVYVADLAAALRHVLAADAAEPQGR